MMWIEVTLALAQLKGVNEDSVFSQGAIKKKETYIISSGGFRVNIWLDISNQSDMRKSLKISSGTETNEARWFYSDVFLS